MPSSSRIQDGPLTKNIRHMFGALTEALAAVAKDAGADSRTARAMAERVIMMLQGSLVLSRGVGSTRPFREFLKSISTELLKPRE